MRTRIIKDRHLRHHVAVIDTQFVFLHDEVGGALGMNNYALAHLLLFCIFPEDSLVILVNVICPTIVTGCSHRTPPLPPPFQSFSI